MIPLQAREPSNVIDLADHTSKLFSLQNIYLIRALVLSASLCHLIFTVIVKEQIRSPFQITRYARDINFAPNIIGRG